MTNTILESQSTPPALSPFAEMLIQAVDSEIKATIFPRHKINALSPSFPWSHRTLANKDALKTGVTEFLMIGGRRYYTKNSLLEFLRTELSGAK